MLSTQISIGSAFKVNVQAKTAEELFEEASLWYELPCQCGKCKSDRLGLRHRRTQDYDFYELKCLDCEATFALGQKKESSGGGLYPRGHKDTGEWEEKYVGNDRESSDRGGDRRRDDRRGGDRGRDNRSTDRGRDDRGSQQRGGYRREAAPANEGDDVPY